MSGAIGAGEEDGGHLVRRGDEPRLGRQVAAAADDDAYRVGTLGVAHREERVVAARRTGPHHDGVGRGAHGVHQAAAGRRGDPAGVAAGRGDLAVERDRRLEGDERQAFADEARERFVQPLAERVHGPSSITTSMPAARRTAMPRPSTAGLGSEAPTTTRATPAATMLLGAGAGAAVAAARLEGHVEGGAARPFAGLLEGHGLGVRRARPAVVALPHHALAGGHDDRADARVGVRQPPAQAGELQSAFELFGVSHDKSPGAHRLQGFLRLHARSLLSSGL